jgi:hypothetical protein
VWTEIETWTFPQLQVLRVDASFIDLPRSSDRIWDTVKVVELLQDQGSIPTSSRIPSILRICPNAAELNYYIEYVYPPDDAVYVAASIQVVRLHFAVNYDLRWPVEEEDVLWTHVFAHLSMLSGPSLKRVVLCGPWNFVIADEQFGLFKRDLGARGCRLDSE